MSNTEKLNGWQLEYAFKAAIDAAVRTASTLVSCPTKSAQSVANAALEAQRILCPTPEQAFQKAVSEEVKKASEVLATAAQGIAKAASGVS